VDVESFRKSLDEQGEENVRRTLSRGAYDPQRVKLAEAWLDERRERSQASSLAIARSAKNAAWAAAIAAAIANVIAIAAIIVSVLAWRAD
jgi:hypothetical protein